MLSAATYRAQLTKYSIVEELRFVNNFFAIFEKLFSGCMAMRRL